MRFGKDGWDGVCVGAGCAHTIERCEGCMVIEVELV